MLYNYFHSTFICVTNIPIQWKMTKARKFHNAKNNICQNLGEGKPPPQKILDSAVIAW